MSRYETQEARHPSRRAPHLKYCCLQRMLRIACILQSECLSWLALIVLHEHSLVATAAIPSGLFGYGWSRRDPCPGYCRERLYAKQDAQRGSPGRLTIYNSVLVLIPIRGEYILLLHPTRAARTR